MCHGQLAARAPSNKGTGRQAASGTINGPERKPQDVYELVKLESHEYDAREMLACVVDADSFQEYKSEFGRALLPS